MRYFFIPFAFLLAGAFAFGAGETRLPSGAIVGGSMSIGSGSAANSSALLDLSSTTKGLLPPRMTTTQRDGISSPQAGLVIQNTTTGKLNYYNGSAWLELSSLTGTETLSAKTMTSPTVNSATLSAPLLSDYQDVTEQGSAPSSPASGKRRMYVKTDGKAYLKDSSGIETQLGSGGGGGLYEGGQNTLANNSWESDTSNWTASGGTYSRTTTAANIIPPGVGAGSWDSSSASQALLSDSVTITSGDGLSGRNGVASCAFKAASGTATHKIQAFDGTNVLVESTITSSTSGFVRTSVNFSFPASGTIALRVISVASDEPTIYVDDCYLGLAEGFNLGMVNTISDWVSFTPTGSWTTNTTYSGMRRRVGDTEEFVISLALSGAPTATALTVNLPVTIDTAKVPGDTRFYGETTLAAGGYGSTQRGIGYVYHSTTTAVGVGVIDDSSASGNDVRSLTHNDPAVLGNGDRVVLRFKVPVVGYQSEQAYRPDQVAWRVDANISGAHVSIPSGNQATYAEMTNGSLTLTQNDGSIGTQIACASGTASSGTTCSAANESIGIAFTVPRAGDVLACASFGHYLQSGASALDLTTVFEIIETTNTSSAVVSEGKARISTGSASLPVNSSVFYPVRVCGNFSFSSAGLKTLRLAYEQSQTTAANQNLILADAASAAGQRDIHWEVYPITQNIPATLLVGSVTSNSSGQERVERVQSATTCTSTPCTISSQSGSWVSSITRHSTGLYTVNIAAGMFSSAPTCFAQAYIGTNAANYIQDGNVAPSTSAFKFQCNRKDTHVADDCAFGVVCMGPR